MVVFFFNHILHLILAFLFIFCPLICLVNQSLAHHSKCLICQHQCQLISTAKEVPFSHGAISTLQFHRLACVLIIVVIIVVSDIIIYLDSAQAVNTNSTYMSVPQMTLGGCVNNAPVAFLENFEVKCVTLLHSCPTGSPLQTLLTDLRIQVKNGLDTSMSNRLNKL